jgi:anti-sigma-K factor RskA
MIGLTCEEALDLLPLLAIDALDVDERDVLEDHLATCEACQAEAASYSETAAVLALALPQADPPPNLKGRLLAAARRPRVVDTDESRLGRSDAGSTSRRLPFWRVTMSGLVAAVALLVAIGAIFWAMNLRSELDAQSAQITTLTERAQNYQRVASVLQAADTQTRLLNGTNDAPSAFGRVYVDPETGEGMLMVRGLPPLPQGRSYQLWVVGTDGQRQSAGVLTWTDRQGNGYTLIQCPDKLARWQSFGVTQEPVGGSNGPTGPRMLGGSI